MDISDFFPQVRIEKIKLTNFKGVANGVIEFNCLKNPFEKDTQSDLLGIYGQNGSGKTTLLEALHVAKLVIMGRHLSKEKYSGLIAQNADYARMEIAFQFANPDNSLFHLEYAFSLAIQDVVPDEETINDMMKASVEKKDEFASKMGKIAIAAMMPFPSSLVAMSAMDRIKKNDNMKSFAISRTQLVVCDEVLSLSGRFNGSDIRFAPIFDARSEEVPLLPKAKQAEFFPIKTPSAMRELLKYRVRAAYNSSSFIFSSDVRYLIYEQIAQGSKSEYAWLIILLQDYVATNIRVLDSIVIGASRDNVLPLYTAQRGVNIHLNNSTAYLDEEGVETLQKSIKGLNVILKQLIPELSLEAVEQIDIDASTKEEINRKRRGKKVTVYTVRNNTRIPLSQESPGIMKLVSSLGLIAYAFSNPNVTVAIDEIDAGVYEYLLGELLLVFEESGRGQLIFTCHNLRPLEVLEKKYICFTTTNPENRYLKLKGVRKEKNLRDVYLSEIISGEQEEELYSSAKHGKIASALRKAGEIIA